MLSVKAFFDGKKIEFIESRPKITRRTQVIITFLNEEAAEDIEELEFTERQRKWEVFTQDLEKEPLWKEEDHPDLKTPADIDKYVRKLREAWITVGN